MKGRKVSERTVDKAGCDSRARNMEYRLQQVYRLQVSRFRFVRH